MSRSEGIEEILEFGGTLFVLARYSVSRGNDQTAVAPATQSYSGPPSMNSIVTACRGTRTLTWVVVPGVAGLIALTAHGVPRSGQSALSARPVMTGPGGLPVAVGAEADLGALPPGRAGSGSLRVQNVSSERLTVERVETSCPCVVVRGLPVSLESNEARDLELSFDPSEDPEFRGALCVGATGFLSGGRVAFRTNVNLRVEARGGYARP